MAYKKLLSVWLLATALASCTTSYHVTKQTASQTTIDSVTAPADASMAAFLLPYRQKVDQTMNEVIAQSAGTIEKKQPDGPLNDLLTDALLQQATKRYGKPIDVSHLNFGGIRSNLPAGAITIGSVFEVMPFDNQIVVLTLKGNMLQQLLNHFAVDDKLVVGGVRVTTQAGKVQDIQFTNGRAFRPEETYTVAMSDFVANGGDNAAFLADAVRRENLNYLIRDALIDFFRQQGKTGVPITPTSDGRITVK